MRFRDFGVVHSHPARPAVEVSTNASKLHFHGPGGDPILCKGFFLCTPKKKALVRALSASARQVDGRFLRNFEAQEGTWPLMRPVLCKSAQNGIGARNRRVFSLTALLSSASCLVGRARESSQKHVNPGENLSLAHFGGAHSSEASPGPLAPGKFFVQKFSFCAHKKSGSYILAGVPECHKP